MTDNDALETISRVQGELVRDIRGSIQTYNQDPTIGGVLHRLVDEAIGKGVPHEEILEIIAAQGLNVQFFEKTPTGKGVFARNFSGVWVYEDTSLPIKQEGEVDINLSTENGETTLREGDYVWKVKGVLETFKIGQDLEKFIIFSDDDESQGGMSYHSLFDLFYVRKSLLLELKDYSDLIDSCLLHEFAHKRYCDLSKADQILLNDMFLYNESLRYLLLQFADTLHTGSKVDYLSSHLINDNSYIVGNKIKGFKDNRTLLMQFNKEYFQISLPRVISEFISYSSFLFLNPEAKHNIKDWTPARSMESQFNFVLEAGWEEIRNNSKIYALFERMNLFRDAPNIPALRQELLDGVDDSILRRVKRGLKKTFKLKR